MVSHYKLVEVSEQQLEELVRRHCGMIEEGLVYVDHQKSVGSGRLDVLMVDSGKSLVVAELKVTQDDNMLMQGVDYYDYVSNHTEAYGRLYRGRGIDPTQDVRLLLIAPSFSQALVNRCKWLNLPISLFTFHCLKFDGQEDLVAIFSEEEIPTPADPPVVTSIDEHVSYITDIEVRNKVSTFLNEIPDWKPGCISLDPITDFISMKVSNHVFAYYGSCRKHYILFTYDAQDQWTKYTIRTDDDLAKVKSIMRAAMERRVR